MIRKVGSGSPWENAVGYSRAVRVGNIVEVSGTVSVVEGKPFAVGDPYKQTMRIFEIISGALERLDARLDHVVRTRIYVTDISMWSEIGRAHGEIFGDIKPAATMVEVSKLINPEYLVEIEATAIIPAE